MSSALDVVEIMLLGAPHESFSIEGTFILQVSTIRAFPNSLLAEKLEALKDGTNQIFIERGVRQFKLIRQLMVYRDWARIDNMTSAERRELEYDLRFYKLQEFYRYLKPYAESDEHNRRYLFAKKYIFPATPRRPLVLVWIEHDDPRYKDLFKNFNYNKYDVVHGLALEPENLDMFLYSTDRKKVFSLNVIKKKPREIERLFFIFLLAVERYDFKHKLLVSRKDFEPFPELKLQDQSMF